MVQVRFSVIRFCAVTLLIVLTFLSSSPAPVAAATFAVNSTGDASDANPGNGICETASGNRVCTLRAAIQENNGGAGGNTITVPVGTYTIGSYLRVSKSITINGAGAASTIVDGANATRAFYFEPTSGTHAISNLTIQHMIVTIANDPITEALRQGNGGAILNEATLTLTNVTIANNRAVQGGGIYNMYDFVGSGNTIYVPTLNLNTVTINSNVATGSANGQGGGGLFNGGALNGQTVTITGNSARQGAGWYNNNPHNQSVAYAVTMNGFTISNNQATIDAGGGIDNDLGTITLSNGTLSGNTAITSGGGIYNNHRQQVGGVWTTTNMSLTNVTVSGNSVPYSGGVGGGILNIETMTLTNVTINGNSANYGAGIQNGNNTGYPNNLTMTNTTVSGNTGLTFGIRQARGGGIFNTFNGQLILNNATITLNSAVAGGGLDTVVNVLSGNSVTIRNSILAGNTADAGWGPDCEGTLTSGGYNLLGNTTHCTLSGGTGELLNATPQLGGLQNNGGSTNTHALTATSPAINTGNPSAPGSGGNTCAATDQRGIARPQGARCDIGAYESDLVSIVSLNPSSKWFGTSGFTLVATGSNFVNGFIVQWNGNDRSTTFINSTQLNATIPASDLITPRAVTVRVRDPGNAQNASNTLTFWVIGPLYLPLIQKTAP
jgi:CSLREA domain-containing protein